MRKILPVLVILLSTSYISCDKKDFQLSQTPAEPLVFQLPQTCSMKEDAARNAAARAKRTAENNSSPVVLLLDFNGHELENTVWNSGQTWNCSAVPAAKLSKAMKDQIFASVSEDYSAFNIIVTKSEAEYQAAAPGRRMRCVITHNMISQFGNVGGTAFVGSMAWGDETPCLVFCDPLLYNAQYISGAVAHELGHTFGLQHQARFNEGCSMQEEYHSGEGDGALSWAPIMGLSYYKSLVTWHQGTSVLGCEDMQHDAQIITETAAFRVDDYKENLNNNTMLLPSNGTKKGILEQACDLDAFKKNETGAKRIRIISAGNTDFALEVYNLNGNLVAVHDDNDGTGVNAVVNGKKYLRVRVSDTQPFVPEGDGFGGYTIQVNSVD